MARRARGALAKLLADPTLAALRGVLAEDGARAWIVGGALRDLVLHREAAELDLAVDGDAEKIARRLESLGLGRAVLLSGDRSPRVFRVAGRGRTLDLAEIEGGSIHSDLARRDFTANAVAVDVASGELVDPFGGLTDLASKRLRPVAAKNLADDPLRALRAARLFATHDLAPDLSTSRASREAAPALGRVARERVQAELDKLLGAGRAAPALEWAARVGLFEPAFAVHVSPGRARAAARALVPFDSPALGRLPAQRRRRLRLALLARRLEIGSTAAAAWLRGLRWGTDEAGAVERLLALADRAKRGPRGDDAWRWLLDAGEEALDALRLLDAIDPDARAVSRRLGALARARRPIPNVRGTDVLEWLGITPGPEVGRLLEAVRVEALAGRISTVGQARVWLLRRATTSPASSGRVRETGRRPTRL